MSLKRKEEDAYGKASDMCRKGHSLVCSCPDGKTDWRTYARRLKPFTTLRTKAEVLALTYQALGDLEVIFYCHLHPSWGSLLPPCCLCEFLECWDSICHALFTWGVSCHSSSPGYLFLVRCLQGFLPTSSTFSDTSFHSSTSISLYSPV